MRFKPILIIFIILFITPFFIFGSVSDEVFREVYTQLEISNQIIEKQQEDIKDLTNQIYTLNVKIEEMSSFLTDTKQKLESAESALNKAKKELNDSSKVITDLKNNNFLIGASVYTNTFNTVGFGAELGYQIFNNIFASVFLDTNLIEYICGLSCKITI